MCIVWQHKCTKQIKCGQKPCKEPNSAKTMTSKKVSTTAISAPLAALLCDSGGGEQCQIGQGHLFRCRAFAENLQALGWNTALFELRSSNKPARSTPLRFTQVFDEACPKAALAHATNAKNAKPAQAAEYCCPLSAQTLQSLACLPGGFGSAKPAPRLFVIDSYQLPWQFYQHIAQRLPTAKLLALDDCAGTTRLCYPQSFFILQALRSSAPLEPGTGTKPNPYLRYLYGLQYQVLRAQ